MGNHIPLDALRQVPFVHRARWQGADTLVLTTDGRPDHILSAAPFTRGALRTLLENGARPRSQVVLLRGNIDPELATSLRDASISYIDEAGNCSLTIGDQLGIYVEGRRLIEPIATPTGMRSAGYRALFALLVRPQLVAEPLREIALRAGVSTTTATGLLRTLHAEGSVTTVKGRARLRVNDELIDRWLVGYRDVVRPSLFAGRFEVPAGGLDALRRILDSRLKVEWRWGGAFAAKLLGGRLNDTHILVHTLNWLHRDLPRLPLRPNPDGEITVLGAPGPLAFPPESRAVHPLLVYSELRMDPDIRAQEAAAEQRERAPLTGET